MKEATGELNMTVITIVAIAAIAAFFYAFVWPAIQVSIARSQCEAQCGKENTPNITRATLEEEDWSCICENQ